MGAFPHLHLSFPNHMHDLDAGQNDARTPKILEALHRFHDAFDGPAILLDNVVQVLALPNLDRCFPLRIDRLKGRQIRAAFVHRHSFRCTVLVDRLLKVPLRGSLVPVGSKQKIDRIAVLVHRPI